MANKLVVYDTNKRHAVPNDGDIVDASNLISSDEGNALGKGSDGGMMLPLSKVGGVTVHPAGTTVSLLKLPAGKHDIGPGVVVHGLMNTMEYVYRIYLDVWDTGYRKATIYAKWNIIGGGKVHVEEYVLARQPGKQELFMWSRVGPLDNINPLPSSQTFTLVDPSVVYGISEA